LPADRAGLTQKRTCALARTQLCDGQLLELPDYSLASCLCWLEDRANEAGFRFVAEAARDERSALRQQLGAQTSW